MLQASVAGSVVDAAVTQAQLRRLLSLPDGDEEVQPLPPVAPPQTTAAPAAAVPAASAAPASALVLQLQRAKAGQDDGDALPPAELRGNVAGKSPAYRAVLHIFVAPACGAAGVNLPVLADLGSSAVLRFSELFAGDEVTAVVPAAKPGKERQPRRAVLPGVCSKHNLRMACLSFCTAFWRRCNSPEFVFPPARLPVTDCRADPVRLPAEGTALEEDEAGLLHGEDVDALEAEAWASEPEGDEGSKAEGGESGDDEAGEGPGSDTGRSKPREQEQEREPDEAVVQSAMPAKRMWVTRVILLPNLKEPAPVWPLLAPLSQKSLPFVIPLACLHRVAVWSWRIRTTPGVST